MVERKIRTGPRGGKYVLVKGKKRYIKSTATKKKVVHKGKGVGRGGATRGWREEAPNRKYKRATLPESCFLMPKERKYPICDMDGNIDCRGLVAAKSRSHQYKNEAVYKKATRLHNKLCKK